MFAQMHEKNAMIGAIQNGDFNTIYKYFLLEDNKDPDFDLGNDGNTLLYNACKYKKYDIVEFLIKRGGDINLWNKLESSNPLLVSVASGFLEIVRLLLKSKASLAVNDTEGNCILHIAVTRADINENGILLIKSIIEASSELLGRTNFQRRTPLLENIKFGEKRHEISQILLRAGASVNAQDIQGDTPLIVACKYGDPELVALFIGHYANVKHEGKNALIYARERADYSEEDTNSEDIIKMLFNPDLVPKLIRKLPIRTRNDNARSSGDVCYSGLFTAVK